jgi:hypothetical protein
MSKRLLGVMVKGPKELDKSRIPYAIKQASKVAPFEFEAQKVAWAGQVVHDFVSFWENPSHLDVAKIQDPDDEKTVIVFAGDSVPVEMGTSGKLQYKNEPKGKAFSILKTAMLARIFPLFNIR